MNSDHSIIHSDFFQWPETRKLIDFFSTAQIDARFVGGAVRNTLLNRPVLDVDLCTKALPEALLKALEAHHIKAVPTGIAHGTISAIISKRIFEITTLRRDVACDGRHAEVEFSDSYAEDAARRDFTVNALYADFSGRIYDYHQGLDDLNARTLRFIGNAKTRIEEDSLRMLRLFRFQAALKFEPDAAALSACTLHAHRLQNISAERIQAEWLKLLGAANPSAALTAMDKAGILRVIFQENIQSNITPYLQAEAAFVQPINPLARMAFLAGIHGVATPSTCSQYFKTRLALSNDQERHLFTWFTYANRLSAELSVKDQQKIQRTLGTEKFLQLVIFAAARDQSSELPTYQIMIERARNWQPPMFPLKGSDLLAIGFTAGPALGVLLTQLENAWEDSNYTLDKNALMQQAKTHSV